MVELHICTNDRDDSFAGCICAIGKDHDEATFQAWEDNDWQDPALTPGDTK